jgi:hypothetical protein
MARQLPDRNELARMRSQGWRLEDLGAGTSEVTDDEIEAFFRDNTP